MLHGHFFGFYMQFQSFLGRLGLSISWGYSSRLKMGRTKTKRYFELLLEFIHSAQIYTIHVCLSCILLWTWTMMICRDEPNQNYLRVEAEALALYVLKDPKCSSKDLNTYHITLSLSHGFTVVVELHSLPCRWFWLCLRMGCKIRLLQKVLSVKENTLKNA